MPVYNLLDFRAGGVGKTLDTLAIQSVINACHAAGGGTVIFPAGKSYLSGTLQLKSNVELHLERGATLLASSDYADYPEALNSDVVTGGEYDIRPCPGEGILHHPTAGFFLKNAENITMRNCELVVRNCPTFGEPVEVREVLNFVNQGFFIR